MKKIVGLVVLASLAALARPASGQTEQDKTKVLTLRDAVRMATEQNPIRAAADRDVDRAALDVRKARSQRILPRLNVEFYTGLTPEARGDIFSSPDRADVLHDVGPFYKLDFELIKPLYTFGRISSAIRASKQGLLAETAQREQTLQTLALQVVEAYWGVSASLKGEAVARELRKSYDELLTEVQKRLLDEKSGVDDSDLLEVKSFEFAVEESASDATEKRKLSTLALNGLLNRGWDEDAVTSNEEAPAFGLEESGLDAIRARAEKTSPDLQAAAAGAQVLRAKLQLTRSDRFPVFFFGGAFKYGHAGNRDKQTNPFAVENFNYQRLGMTLGAKWNADLYTQDIEVRKAGDAYASALEKVKALQLKIDVEVSRSFMTAGKNEALLAAARRSVKSARTWLRVSTENWDMGIGDTKRLLDAYEAYYRLRRIEIEQEYQYNISLARLAQAMGDIEFYLQWVENGKVIPE
jgi:outer membrane protein TolC